MLKIKDLEPNNIYWIKTGRCVQKAIPLYLNHQSKWKIEIEGQSQFIKTGTLKQIYGKKSIIRKFNPKTDICENLKSFLESENYENNYIKHFFAKHYITFQKNLENSPTPFLANQLYFSIGQGIDIVIPNIDNGNKKLYFIFKDKID